MSREFETKYARFIAFVDIYETLMRLDIDMGSILTGDIHKYLKRLYG